jgi:hypothetical protein
LFDVTELRSVPSFRSSIRHISADGGCLATPAATFLFLPVRRIDFREPIGLLAVL